MQGEKPGDVCFVQADCRTMPQEDIDHGRLHVVVGVAMVRPQEFTVLKILFQTARSWNEVGKFIRPLNY